MKLSSHALIAAILTAVLSLPTPARALFRTVNFTVLADPNDPFLHGQTANGSFSWDEDLLGWQNAYANGRYWFYVESGLGVSDMSFAWDGHTWTCDDADAWWLGYDSDREFYLWNIGGTGQTAVHSSGALLDVPALIDYPGPDFLAGVSVPTALSSQFGPAFAYFNYKLDSDDTYYLGSIVGWSVSTHAVPEPGIGTLLGLGLLGLRMIRRRKR